MDHPAMAYRRSESSAAESEIFDVAVIGGGVTGACLFHQLRRNGYKVLLADKSDFAGGTSQASAMMLWGGLAYLRSLDLATVFRLCSSREAMVAGMQECVQPRLFRYIVPSPKRGNRVTVQSALYLYWLLGRRRRTRPRYVHNFNHPPLLKPQPRNCFEYEEAYLPDSDSRFVIQWILRARDWCNPALNYCRIHGGQFDSAARQWVLEAEDLVLRRQFRIRARLVVNAAGVWTDSLNRQFGIQTPYKHILSKGVFIGIPRHPEHDTPLIVEKEDRDCYALIPWGPISLWGPTETITSNPMDGFAVTAEDIGDLTREYDRHFSSPLQIQDIVSFRCGVRGLAVPRSAQAVGRSQDLSRKFTVHHDSEKPWVSIHGGKLTSCLQTANAAIDTIRRSVRPRHNIPLSFKGGWTSPANEHFPGLNERVPSAMACALESCWSLKDYLRRRTNIAQWVPRGGLGRFDENLAHLKQLAGAFASSTNFDASLAVSEYRKDIETQFDRVLDACLPTPVMEVL